MSEDRRTAPSQAAVPSVEGRASWGAAAAAVVILALAYGAPLIVVVDLTRIQAALGTDRSVIALASALVWLGTGVGGIVMGRLADRFGIKTITAFGAVMVAGGLAVSSTGSLAALLIGHGLMMGFFGNGALYPPLVIHISRRFDRHRGTAIALISSGQYIAGVFWPAPFEHATLAIGWQTTMLAYAALVLVSVVPLTLTLRPAPAQLPGPAHDAAGRPAASQSPAAHRGIPGLSERRLQVMLCVASFLCCVPMAIPSAHLPAFAGNLGISPADGAAMLSLMLGTAFIGRQFWGWLAEHIGGLRTLFLGELCQTLAIVAFAVVRNETGLFVLAGSYGLGFSGIIPSYVLVVRETYSWADAATRIPLVLFTSTLGMAFGTWLAGALFDHFGSYTPAFLSGALFNLVNIAILGFILAHASGFRLGARRPGRAGAR